jgi:hypothetical protein
MFFLEILMMLFLSSNMNHCIFMSNEYWLIDTNEVQTLIGLGLGVLSDTDGIITYNYIELCYFLKLLSVLSDSLCGACASSINHCQVIRLKLMNCSGESEFNFWCEQFLAIFYFPRLNFGLPKTLLLRN